MVQSHGTNSNEVGPCVHWEIRRNLIKSAGFYCSVGQSEQSDSLTKKHGLLVFGLNQGHAHTRNRETKG